MKWQKLTLISEITTGEQDELGNDCVEELEVLDTTGRISEWNTEDIQLLGRDFTSSHRKILTKAPFREVKATVKVKIDETCYAVESFKDLGRWRLIYVKGYRV